MRLLLLLHFLSVVAHVLPANIYRERSNAKILILGGGVSGIIAARTLTEQGLTNFVIIEGRDELGGRLRSREFGAEDKMKVTLEVGANWVQGTQKGNGPANPIFELAKKHEIKTQINHCFESLTTYDVNGLADYVDVFEKAISDYERLTITGGGRVAQSLVDSNSRAGYSLSGVKPQSDHERAAEYFQFDYEYAQTPEQTSLIASSWANNFTFNGFSDSNLLSVDQRGFKTMLQAEAQEFLQAGQVMLNSIVEQVDYSGTGAVGVSVHLQDGRLVTGDYALCTFSLGVLQNDDVIFEPDLPAWKEEAIHTMTMGTYTKIFLQFQDKFWFDTEMALYADPERGRYPVWQSLDHEDFFPGSGILFVTVTGDFSVRIEALPDQHVKEEVMDVLGKMFPEVDIPEPLDFYFQRWHSEPLYRGSYSNWPPSFVSEHHDNLRANVGRLFFAGEATSQKYFGFLHGAYYEGSDVAMVLARCIKESICDVLKHVDAVVHERPYDI